MAKPACENQPKKVTATVTRHCPVQREETTDEVDTSIAQTQHIRIYVDMSHSLKQDRAAVCNGLNYVGSSSKCVVYHAAYGIGCEETVQRDPVAAMQHLLHNIFTVIFTTNQPTFQPSPQLSSQP